jgi:hypothetical protein
MIDVELLVALGHQMGQREQGDRKEMEAAFYRRWSGEASLGSEEAGDWVKGPGVEAHRGSVGEGAGGRCWPCGLLACQATCPCAPGLSWLCPPSAKPLQPSDMFPAASGRTTGSDLLASGLSFGQESKDNSRRKQRTGSRAGEGRWGSVLPRCNRHLTLHLGVSTQAEN